MVNTKYIEVVNKSVKYCYSDEVCVPRMKKLRYMILLNITACMI